MEVVLVALGAKEGPEATGAADVADWIVVAAVATEGLLAPPEPGVTNEGAALGAALGAAGPETVLPLPATIDAEFAASADGETAGAPPAMAVAVAAGGAAGD